MATSKSPAGHALMIYDGLCGFCNSSVRWVIKRDRRDRIRFAPQQAALAEAALARHSVYLLLNFDTSQERLLRRSDVTVQVLLLLGGGWRLLGRTLALIPRWLRDRAYMLVARNRFHFRGRYDSCPLPSTTERAKFVGL